MVSFKYQQVKIHKEGTILKWNGAVHDKELSACFFTKKVFFSIQF